MTSGKRKPEPLRLLYWEPTHKVGAREGRRFSFMLPRKLGG